MDSTVSTYFSQFTKDELSVILNYFEHPAKKSTKKADLVSMVSDLIGGQPREWLCLLMERDLLLLRDLVSAGPEQWVRVEMPEYPSMLDLLHLVYIDDYSSEDVYACLDRSLFFPVAAIIDDVIKEKEADGSFKRERIVLGFLNIYGTIPVGDFVETVFDTFDAGDDGTDIVMSLADCQLVALQKAFYKDDVHMVSPFTFDHQQIIDGRDNFPDVKDFARYSIEEVEQAGTGVPYCAFGRGTDEYRAVMDALEDIGYSSEESEALISGIWQDSQYAMQDSFAESMFECVNSRMDEIDSFDDYRKAIDAIAAYANSVPKWLLKGHTANELNMLKLSIRIDEKYNEDGSDPFEIELPEEKIDDIPGPLKEFYKFGIGVRHVRPFDPCPCGSGLSYCRCHGKNLN